MSEVHFPALDDFYERFRAAIKESGSEQRFLDKWGIRALSDVYDILKNNVQGGYDSHKNLILSTPPSDSILTVGPGMGFCVFLLAELHESVFVAEPDEENCRLIEDLSTHYVTSDGRRGNDAVKVFHAGISITDNAIKYWDLKRSQMKSRNVKGSILNFTISGADDLKSIFDQRVSRIYLHKVLSSLSISSSFENLLMELITLLKKDGTVTWAEPDYIFEDILSVEGLDGNVAMLKPFFAKERVDIDVGSYRVRSTIGGSVSTSTWTLLKARKI